jgi:hypothetical protein
MEMRVSNLSRFWFFPICAAFALSLSGGVKADEDGAKGKGKGEKPNIVQLDLNKLPPDLAKALQKFIDEENKFAKGKPSKGEPSKGEPSKGEPSKGEPSKGNKGEPSKGTKGDDLESRLDRLMLEIEAIRREIRGKK